MKIAIISDIHGNLPALETVMKDINRRKADRIICLGDIIGKGPSSKESVDICKHECDTVIIGNWDDGIYKAYIVLNQGQADEIDAKNRWYINSIGSQRIEYLGSLPHSTEFYMSGKLVRLFHAHPQNFSRYYADSLIENRMELFGFSDDSDLKKTANVAIYGDIHNAYMQTVEGRQLLNVGSVGNPLDITQASYVILEGDGNEDAGFGVQFIRVPYDIERAVSIAIEVDVPDLDGYISELRTAVYFKRSYIK